jgi:hypothetical protein
MGKRLKRKLTDSGAKCLHCLVNLNGRHLVPGTWAREGLAVDPKGNLVAAQVDVAAVVVVHLEADPAVLLEEIVGVHHPDVGQVVLPLAGSLLGCSVACKCLTQINGAR